MRIVSLYAHVSSPQNGSMLEIAQPAGEYESASLSRWNHETFRARASGLIAVSATADVEACTVCHAAC
ncbi:hypothetical protein V1477_002677 [Vespula maculifrons]|uniref:Uncharacterized protein n=2 Tax=Vespula TaxID=7451 RepID=A0ABD2ADF4_VESSQ